MLKEKLIKNEEVKPNTREMEILKNNFPHFFDENGSFLIDKFHQMLKTEEIKVQKEGYELKFLGKSYARYITSTETETVIVPDIIHNKEEINNKSENLYIVGDNLDGLKHLLKSYSNKVKCIYIDPPYNTGSDGFVYPDNYQFTPEIMSEKMGIDIEEATRIIDMRGKSTHSAWLTFIYPRLVLARELLSDDGVIFISIDDNEQANLKMICDEIFGEENFVGNLPTIMNLKGNQDEFAFAGTHEYTLVYSKKKDNLIISGLNLDEEEVLLDWSEDDKGFYKKGASLISTGQNAPREHRPKLWFPILYKKGKIELPEEKILNLIYDNELKKFNDDILDKYTTEMKGNGYITILPFVNKQKARWRWSYNKLQRQLEEVIITETKNGISLNKKQRPELTDLPSRKMKTLLYKPEYSSGNGTNEIKQLFNIDRVFSNPKPFALIRDLLNISTNKNDIILDFFSGSSTTAHAVMQLNAEDGGDRKYIMVQLPEKTYKEKVDNKGNIKIEETQAYKEGYKTIDEIGRERIKRAANKIKEETSADIDYGFKLFRLETPNANTLDKIVDFDPENEKILITDNFINEFKFGKTEGLDTIITTWLNEDGYGLNAKANEVLLENYKILVYKESGYIIEEGITTEDIMALINKIESNELQIDKIVIYPYSIPFSILQEMKLNFKNLKNNKTVRLIERY